MLHEKIIFIFIFFIFNFGEGSVANKYKFRLAHGYYGRLYAGVNYGFGIDSFGTVCQGTGNFALTGKNLENFGNVICKKMGLGPMKFAGIASKYSSYHKQENLKDNFENEGICVPDFVISGAKCSNGKCQKIINYQEDGGTCLRGKSDIFLDCELKVQLKRKSVKRRGLLKKGTWSEWTSGSPCGPDQQFQQLFRECRNKQGKHTPLFCGGGNSKWLKLKRCEYHGHKDINYNLEYNYDYDSSDYPSRSPRSIEPTKEGRRRRSCRLDTRLHRNATESYIDYSSDEKR